MVLKFKNTRRLSPSIQQLSPLALLTLAACGGGDGGGTSSGSSSFSGSIIGNVVKGPLSNALVFLDYNDNGQLDAGETSVRTGTDGSYTLSSSQGSVSIVALTDDSTIDSSSGSVLSGITLKAPAGASVVSPNTTIMKETGLTATQVAKVLGLPEGIDPTTFNPYGAGVNAADALAVEKISQQIISTIATFAAAIEGSGASAADAFTAALSSVVEVVQAKNTAIQSDPSATLDLTSSTVLSSIKTAVTTKAASVSGVNKTALDALAADTATAIANVNAKISTVTDLTSDATANIFSTVNVLKDQVEAATKTEVSGGSGSIAFTNPSSVNTAATNGAPTNIALSSSSISEGASLTLSGLSAGYVIGTLTTTDDSSSGFIYKIAKISGTDHASFGVNASTGELSLASKPSFETKASYSVTVVSTDSGGKSYSKAFVISVTDANDGPAITSSFTSAGNEDATFTYTFVATDIDANDTLTYSTTNLPSWLSFNTSTGVLSGTPSQTDVGDHFVILSATDSAGKTSTQMFTITIVNVNDAPVISVTGRSTIAENSAQASISTLSVSDVDDTSVTLALTGIGADDSLFEIVDGNLRIKGTADYEAQATYRVQISATDASGSTVVKNLEINVTDAAESITGTIVDGYVAGATVFQDLDNDNVLDSGEPYTVTSATGAFTLSGVISSATAPIKMISGFDIGTNKAIVTSLGVPTTATGNVVVSPIGTVASLAQAQDVEVNLATIVDRVATYFGVSDTSQSNLDLINDDPIQSMKSSSVAVVSAAKDAFEANQYMMALAHTAETIGEYVSSQVDSAIQIALSNISVTNVAALAGGSAAAYEKLGADAFLNQTAARLAPTGTSISITDETALKVYVGNAAAYEGDSTPTAVVYLNHAHSTDVTLTYTFSTATGDTATAGNDFTAQTGSVSILAGYTSATINLPLLADATTENSETFSLEITGTTAGTLPTSAATITVYDSSKTIETNGELSAISELVVTKVVSDVATSLTTAYNSYASSNSASWTISSDVATTAANAILPGLQVITDAFYTIIKAQIDTAAATSDVSAFADALMIANAATKLFDPSDYIGTNINGDGSYPSGQTLITLTSAIQSEYNTDVGLATETSGDVFGTDTSTNFANATVSILTDGNDTETLTDASEIIATFNGTDTVNAGGGNDKILGGTGVDTFDGQAGNDHLYGFSGNDILTGGDGNDTIVGGLGNDIISGGAGNDVILAQTGNDTITSGSGADTLDGGLGDDAITIDGSGNKTINGGSGTDSLVISYSGVSSMSDFASIGYNSSTSILTFTDSNGGTISAKGMETFTVGSTAYSFVDASGNHSTSGEKSNYISHAFIRSDGDEIIFYTPSSGSTQLNINEGLRDFVPSGATWLDAALSITGSAASDNISDGGGDTLNNLGSLTVNAGAGDDTVKITTLTEDADTINLDAGDDIVYVGSDYATDTLNGGTGTDWIAFHHNSYGSNDSGITYTVNAGNSSNFENVGGTTHNDNLTGDGNANKIFGGKGADTITGGSGNDVLIGDIGSGASLGLTGNLKNDHNGHGNDTLYGGAGNDSLYGDEGEDTLDGGIGADTITTGSGADTIVLRKGGGGSTLTDADTITDFTDGTDVFGLDNSLSFSDLVIAQGTGSNAGHAIISIGSTGEYLAIVEGLTASNLTESDFTPVAISNYTPQISSTAVTAATEDASYSYTMAASDLNSSDTISYAAPTLPSWLNFNVSTKVLSGTPSNSDVGSHSVVLTATDNNGAADAQSFTITVANVNETPVVTSTAVTSVNEDASYSYTFAVSDADSGDTISYAAPTKPNWLSLNSSSGVLSGTPSNDQVGNHSVVLTATDSAGVAVTQSFTITVSNVNDTPTVSSTAATAATEDNAYSYTFEASDVDVGDTVTYAATTKPNWLNFNASTGVLSGTPTNGDVGNNSVVLTATDSNSAVTTHSFTITVSNVNTAATVTSTAITSAAEDSAYSYTFAAADPDVGDTITYAAPTKPSWLSINSNTGVLSGTPTNDHVGNHSVILTATDNAGIAVRQSFTITVSNVNEAPTVSSTAATAATEDTAYSYTFEASDVDVGDTVTYAASTKPNWLNFNASTGVLSGTPTNGDVGNNSVVLTATDGSNIVATQSFTIVVANVNDAPNVTSTADTSADAASGYSYTFAASDVDSGDTLTFAAPTLPSWLGFNTGSGVLSGTPSNSDAGNHSIVLTATDSGGLVATQSFTLLVTRAGNNPPTVTSSQIIAVNEDSSYSYTFVANDADDGDSITYSATAKPDWLSFNVANGVLSGTPRNSDVGTHSIVLAATDNAGAQVTQSFTLTVSNTNDTPTVTSTQVTTVNEDSAYSYTFAASDVDAGDTLTYNASTKPGWLSFNASTGVLSGTPDNDDVGTHNVVLNAKDDANVTATQSFTITVGNTNDGPTLSVTNGSVTEDSGTYTASGTLNGADVDVGTTLTYAISSASGSYGSISLNTSSGAYTYTMDNTNSTVQALNGSQTLTENFTVSVSDGIASASQTLGFVINGANDAPTSLALSANSIAENSAGAVVGSLSARDGDGDTLTYSLSSGGDNDSFEISGTTLKLKSSVAADYEANNVYDLTIFASDGVASTSIAKEVTVANVNEANTSYYNNKADTAASANLNPDNNAAIENLMSGYFWGSAGSGIDLTYSFMTNSSSFSSDYNRSGATLNRDNVQNSSTNFKSTVAQSLELFSSVSLLSFSEVEEAGNAVGHLRLGTTQAETSAFAWYPYNNWDAAGDSWFNDTSNYYNNNYALMDGTYWNTTIIHEVGHSLGLAHPFEVQSYGAKTYGSNSDVGTIHNANPYTVMAYAEYVGEPSDLAENIFSRPTTLMIDDIAAIQHLYGVNEQYNATDTTYTLNSFNTGTYNALYGDDYIYASIWDGGGTDTFSWADQSTIASIDLNAGSFSCFGNITGPDDTDLDDTYLLDGDGILGIAYNTVIENAIGGSNVDTIVGNSTANTLYGGAGAGIQDTLTGNGGVDTFVCSLSDATTNISLADIISDFTDGTDFIGLEDRTVSDLSWSNTSGGTQIVDTDSNKILFLLSGVDQSVIDSSDFLVTDIV